MSLPVKMICSVLWHLLLAGTFALHYLLWHNVAGATVPWSVGIAVVMTVSLIVGVPKWGEE